MNYIGSKISLLDFIDKTIHSVVKEPCHIFCDLFAGTGVVGSFFKKKGYQIIANDLQYYSYVLNRHFLKNNQSLTFENLEKIIDSNKESSKEEKVCQYLNNLEGIKGFVFNNYALGGTENNFKRQYFSDSNAQRCDAIRITIEKWHNDKLINEDEYFFLLASLIDAIDKVANTASVYGAFLKHLKKAAKYDLKLTPLEIIKSNLNHKIYNKNANELIRNITTDILYLDPPYNTRQYGANYHVLETIARYDNPEIKGKTGIRNYVKQKSEYCSKLTVKESFSDLITNADTKYIFLSYNNEGLLSPQDIEDVFSKKGQYGCFTKKYNRFKADSARNYKSNQTVEYLHYCICKQ